jgi:hypothetical protein
MPHQFKLKAIMNGVSRLRKDKGTNRKNGLKQILASVCGVYTFDGVKLRMLCENFLL